MARWLGGDGCFLEQSLHEEEVIEEDEYVGILAQWSVAMCAYDTLEGGSRVD